MSSEALAHAVVAKGLPAQFHVLRLDHLEPVALEERTGGDAGLGEQTGDALLRRAHMDVSQQGFERNYSISFAWEVSGSHGNPAHQPNRCHPIGA